MLARVHWQEGRGFYQADFLPLKIYDYGQPVLMDNGQEKDKLLEAVGLSSDGIFNIMPEAGG
jgi:hypothetical protein